MDIEDRLKRLQSLFTYALSGAVAAKARYLALRGDLGATPAAAARAKMAWQQLEARKTAIISRMVALEELEQLERWKLPKTQRRRSERSHESTPPEIRHCAAGDSGADRGARAQAGTLTGEGRSALVLVAAFRHVRW